MLNVKKALLRIKYCLWEETELLSIKYEIDLDDILHLVSEHQHPGPGVHSYVVRELTVWYENPTERTDERQASLVLIETETKKLDTVSIFLVTLKESAQLLDRNLFHRYQHLNHFFSTRQRSINWLVTSRVT